MLCLSPQAEVLRARKEGCCREIFFVDLPNDPEMYCSLKLKVLVYNALVLIVSTGGVMNSLGLNRNTLSYLNGFCCSDSSYCEVFLVSAYSQTTARRKDLCISYRQIVK